MDFVGPIFEVLKCIGPPFYKYFEYQRKLDEYKKNLKRDVDDLKSLKEEVEMRLKADCILRKLPKYEVKKWLENVPKIIHDAENIECTFENGRCFSRARLAQLVDKKIQEVKECRQMGRSFNPLTFDAPPEIGTILPTSALAGETTAKKVLDEIWGYLMGNQIKKMGVCGMGGSGKTTIMTHINNRLLKESVKFDSVIWVTVSQTVDVKLQKEIAVALKEPFGETEDVKRRAGMLLEMLTRRRFALILDDVWKKFSLEKVGIPEPTEENGCKLVITTRLSDVCRLMDCKLVEVKSFSEKEALELFLDKAKLDILKVPTLKKFVELMVKQFAGLPLAIVTVGSSMRGLDDMREWKIALRELSDNVRSIKCMEDEVFGRIKFSYDRLKDEKLQQCFLYCALYPEDYDIPKSELMDCWIAEGFIDEMNNLQATQDKAYIIIKSLVNNCLLLESTHYSRGSCVKLHDVVRDMALSYITSKSPVFMVRAGVELEELPSEEKWKDNVDKVSLMKNSIREIPADVSPNCQKLSTLLLQGNPLCQISESFFVRMQGLRILNLSKTEIENLPDSISDLTNLTALLLGGCSKLEHVPYLGKLLALEELDLGQTRVKRVPEGLEMLRKLRKLNLISEMLKEFPAGILSKLHCLQKFGVYWESNTLPAVIEEVVRLRKLDNFEAWFGNLGVFKCYTDCLKGHQVPNKFRLEVGRDDSFISNFELERNIIIGSRENICERKDSILLLKEVQCLALRSCGDVRSISDVPSFNTLERLEVLQLYYLDDLIVVFQVSKLPFSPYSNLKILQIFNCGKLKKLFSSKLLPKLKNLEEIYVDYCGELEEIISLDIDDEEKQGKKELSLPKLRRLTLYGLGNLKSICNGVLVCDSLQEFRVLWCPLLKRLPFRLPIDERGQPYPPPALKKIVGEIEWWEALEWWDHLHPNAKDLLLPLCHFRPWS